MAIQNTIDSAQTLDSGSSPTFSAVTLTNPLTVANGGTGSSSMTAYGTVISGSTSTSALTAITGTNNQALISNGSSSAPTYQDCWGRAVLLSKQTASSSASIVFSSFTNAAYSWYLIKLVNVLPATNNVSLYLTASTDNGSTYLNSGYYGSQGYAASGGGTGTNSVANGAQWTLFTNASSASAVPAVAILQIYNLANASITPRYLIDGVTTDNSGTATYRIFGGGSFTSAENVTALKLAFSSGNIASGTLILYGIVDDF